MMMLSPAPVAPIPMMRNWTLLAWAGVVTMFRPVGPTSTAIVRREPAGAPLGGISSWPVPNERTFFQFACVAPFSVWGQAAWTQICHSNLSSTYVLLTEKRSIATAFVIEALAEFWTALQTKESLVVAPSSAQLSVLLSAYESLKARSCPRAVLFRVGSVWPPSRCTASVVPQSCSGWVLTLTVALPETG